MTIKEQVLNCGLNEVIQVKPDLTLEFKHDSTGYYWCADREGWLFFPLKNSREVQGFKTLAGCKRNAIRKLYIQ